MGEEIRNRNPELNDAELEGASGGAGDSLIQKAQGVCKGCTSRRSCGSGAEELAEYMAKHGTISRVTECPAFKRS